MADKMSYLGKYSLVDVLPEVVMNPQQGNIPLWKHPKSWPDLIIYSIITTFGTAHCISRFCILHWDSRPDGQWIIVKCFLVSKFPTQRQLAYFTTDEGRGDVKILFLVWQKNIETGEVVYLYFPLLLWLCLTQRNLNVWLGYVSQDIMGLQR